jgi:hypothetical protein|nr:MAG TPA: hypothetical protein [Caudoviricetes sp.]
MRVALRSSKCHPAGWQMPPLTLFLVAGGTWVALQNKPSATRLNRANKPISYFWVALGHLFLIFTRIGLERNCKLAAVFYKKTCIYGADSKISASSATQQAGKRYFPTKNRVALCFQQVPPVPVFLLIEFLTGRFHA